MSDAGSTDEAVTGIHAELRERGLSRILILIGVVLVLVGLLLPWLEKLGLGRLPGDIVIERENFRFYLPIVSALIVGAVVSILLWLFHK